LEDNEGEDAGTGDIAVGLAMTLGGPWEEPRDLGSWGTHLSTGKTRPFWMGETW